MQSQNVKIYLFLKRGGKLTPLKALKLFGCFRLASRANDLRKLGYDVKSEMVTRKGKRFSEYSMS